MTPSWKQNQVGQSQLSVSEIGLGTAPIANLYNDIPVKQAIETVQYAIEQGITFLDTAPYYGLGLSEERIGQALQGVPRQTYAIQTKVGRLIDDKDTWHFDFSADGIRRSLDESLKRLGLDYVDSLLIHDPDVHFDNVDYLIATTIPAMIQLREQGVVKTIGMGMNHWRFPSAVQDYPLDCFMLAGRYTLIEQDSLSALRDFQQRSISVLAAGVYNSGILATGVKNPSQTHYNYQAPPDAIVKRVRHLEAICESHQIPLPAAALQLVKAHPAITSLVSGAESKQQIKQTMDWYQTPIPHSFWRQLVEEHLLSPEAPIPQSD